MRKFPENLKQAGISKTDSAFQIEGVIKSGREWEKNPCNINWKSLPLTFVEPLSDSNTVMNEWIFTI